MFLLKKTVSYYTMNIIESTVYDYGKATKKYENLTKEQKFFIKKILEIRKLEDIDITILKQLKENQKF